MRIKSVLARLLGVAGVATITGIDLDEEGNLVVSVRPHLRLQHLCGRCGRKCPGYDQGDGPRRWRDLDLGSTKTYLKADSPRVSCPEHGPTVAQVPWADHLARFTRRFDDLAAWLAVECSKTAVAELLRIDWETVGSILERVAKRQYAGQDRLQGITRIGIDEISWRRGQRYLTVVVDHDTSRLLWAAEGRDEATLNRFFDELGEERCKLITHVSADAADWIANVARTRCPKAVRCMDPYHVIAWATGALDDVRRQVWNEARRSKRTQLAKDLKGARWVLWKGGEALTPRQQAKLAWVEKTNRPLYTAYLLKEHLRLVFQLPTTEALELLVRWLEWAFDCGIQPCVDLAASVADHLHEIINTLDHKLTNARVEATNTRLRLIARRAYGFHSPQPMIALAMLSQGGRRPTLPGRALPAAA